MSETIEVESATIGLIVTLIPPVTNVIRGKVSWSNKTHSLTNFTSFSKLQHQSLRSSVSSINYSRTYHYVLPKANPLTSPARL
jgi:hypothetical protein